MESQERRMPMYVTEGRICNTDAILLAAGKGVRMKSNVPKQFLRLAGKPLIVYALEVLERVSSISRVLVTHAPGQEDELVALFDTYQLTKTHLIRGGDSRQQSVSNALRRVTSDRVLIHEAVRPFINCEFVTHLLSYEDCAVVPSVPIPFTVAQGNRIMTATLDRSMLHNIQLPQVFDTAVLRKAHQNTSITEATEDSQLVFAAGHKVRLVPGLEENIKITTPLDMLIAEVIYHNMFGWGSQ